ncbi:NADAR domain-containing protein [Myxococcota bacterium]|nr:NADAR domain-containing protein [Myxococcota bacterium]
MVPLEVEALRGAVLGGERFEYLLFWGHSARGDGRLSASCFSQWWASPFVVEGCTYRTAEHWMMAEKARLFGDASSCSRIIAAESPSEAKRLGRGVIGFEESRWCAARFDVVTRGNVAKFSSTPALRDYLLGTGDRILVEASPTDTIWGVGLDASSPAARDPLRWRGANLLGFALVRARGILRGSLPPL